MSCRVSGGLVKEVLVLAAAGPREQDGIGDYSWHLAAALTSLTPDRPATLVVGRPRQTDEAAAVAPSDSNQPRVERLTSWNELRSPEWRRRGEHADCVLLQYFPQAFVAHDFPALADWLGNCRGSGRPVIVTLHEYWPHASLSPAREIMRWRSRRALRRLAEVSTAMAVSQPFSVGELTRSGIVPASKLHVIPVGSAVPRVEHRLRPGQDPGPAKPASRVMAMFGQPAMADARAVRAVAEWMRQSPDPPQLCWFSRSEAELQSWWATHVAFGSHLVMFRGGLPADALSQELQAATIGLALYVDGASTRRSSLAALVEHRLPIVGLDGRYTDERIRSSGAFALVPQDASASLRGTIAAVLDDGARRTRMSAAAEQFFERNLSWSSIASAYHSLEDCR